MLEALHQRVTDAIDGSFQSANLKIASTVRAVYHLSSPDVLGLATQAETEMFDDIFAGYVGLRDPMAMGLARLRKGEWSSILKRVAPAVFLVIEAFDRINTNGCDALKQRGLEKAATLDVQRAEEIRQHGQMLAMRFYEDDSSFAGVGEFLFKRRGSRPTLESYVAHMREDQVLRRTTLG
ncbi:MAG TPA: hypothetical protein VFQ63_04075 [Patescibacteria group bacterium]|nr:hypothetical protein [Patescibacteria group bacterium]